MDLTKDLINGIEEFLNDEEIMNFFEIKGFTLSKEGFR